MSSLWRTHRFDPPVWPWIRPRVVLVFAATVIILSLLVTSRKLGSTSSPRFSIKSTDIANVPAEASDAARAKFPGSLGSYVSLPKDKLHIVIPVSQTDPRLCKNVLSQTLLGYSRPQFVMWKQEFTNDSLLGAGSHLAKITSMLNWLEAPENADKDEDLVVMTDAYDVWFQLPPETLISRYYVLLAEENDRIYQRMGSAAAKENIEGKVIWAASKRCGPNDLHSVACYAVPESSLEEDVYGDWTDTMNAPSTYRWAGLRQRHLVSGFAIGKVKDMRRIFQRANEKMEYCLKNDMKGKPYYRKNCHRGSDQSFFNEMFGEQEYHREVMRRHHRTWLDEQLEDRYQRYGRGRKAGSAPRPHKIENDVINDPLNPDFNHMQMEHPEYDPDQPYEFGILVDQFSEIAHQTSNAILDAAYIVHSDPIEPQLRTENVAHGFDIKCNPAKTAMPLDLFDDSPALDYFPGDKRYEWAQLKLYSEVCAGTIPVVAHHNWVRKWPIEKLWGQNWWTGFARDLLEERKRRADGDPNLVGGADTDTGETLTFEELCPVEWHEELFVKK